MPALFGGVFNLTHSITSKKKQSFNIKLTEDRRHLLTCDRDEKIRVSSYPNCYNIAGYCLGHSEFVTSLALVPGSNHKVLSSSGDGTVKVSSSTHVTFCF